MNAHILIVDDERALADLLSIYLTNAGFRTSICADGASALAAIAQEAPDLALLDVMLPDMSGFDICREIRRDHFFPIIMLTAKIEDNDKILGLTLGADDYITKPFEPEEVLARIEAALRRVGKESTNDKPLTHRALTLSPSLRKATLAGQELALTAHEFDILELLMRQPEKVYTRESLYEQVWHGGYYGENNTVNVHVSNIRKKLKAIDPDADYIQTVYGIGFKLQ